MFIRSSEQSMTLRNSSFLAQGRIHNRMKARNDLVAIRISGRPLVSNSATAFLLNASVTSRRTFLINHLPVRRRAS
jgi:hypothetical protein